MAFAFQLEPDFFTFMVIFSIFTKIGDCFNPKLFNVSMPVQYNSNWLPAGATWYGAPTGAGSDGGACGYLEAVGHPPFNALITAGGPSIFKGGKGCGACYHVRCTSSGACSGNPVTVVVTDSCPGGPCASEPVHFDLSGAAFGAMAKFGLANQLRNVGVVQVQYRRVNCFYPNTKLSFRVDSGSNPFYLAVIIEYVNGEGEIGAVALKQASSSTWQPMQESSGAVWKLNSGSPLRPPLSIKITAPHSRRSIVAFNVIPLGWKPGFTYLSNTNF